METLCATSRNGNLGYGAQFKCFYVPFSEYNLYGDRVAGSYYTETSATINVSYNFLAGYDFKGLDSTSARVRLPKKEEFPKLLEAIKEINAL